VVARPRRAEQSSENFEASHPQFVAITTEYSALLSALGICRGKATRRESYWFLSRKDGPPAFAKLRRGKQGRGYSSRSLD
jgi:hypothetical protein